MFNLNDLLAVLATLPPCDQTQPTVAAKFEYHHRTGEILKAKDLIGSTETLVRWHFNDENYSIQSLPCGLWRSAHASG